MQQKTTTRLLWVESLRWLLIWFIYTWHFFMWFDYWIYWDYFAAEGAILYGFTGKVVVAGFGVLLGYFAAAQAQKANFEFVPYLTKRYLRFSLLLFSVGLVSVAAQRLIVPEYDAELYCLGNVLKETITLAPNVVGVAWCLAPFFVGSVVIAVLCRLQGGRAARWLMPLGVGVLMLAGRVQDNVWIAICLLGACVRIYEPLWRRIGTKKFAAWQSLGIVVAVAIATVWLIRRTETRAAYFLDALACCLIFVLLQNAPRAQKVLSWRPLAWLGGVSFEFMAIHVLIFRLWDARINPLIAAPGSVVSEAMGHFLMYTCCLVLSLALAVCLKAFLDFVLEKTRPIWGNVTVQPAQECTTKENV